MLSAFGTHVDDVVGKLDDVEVVLDDDDGVALVDESVEHLHEGADVLEVESCGGLVEDVEGATGVLLCEFGGEFHALALSARKSGGGLTELDVAEADFLQHLDLLEYLGLVLEELDGLVDGHVEHVGDALALEADLEGLAVVALAVAGFAGHEHVGQEVHLDGLVAVAATGLAASAGDVEGEASGLVGTHLRLGHLDEEFADVGEDLGIGGGIASGGATKGRLIDADHLVDVFNTINSIERKWLLLRGGIEILAEVGLEGLVDEGGFAAAAHAGDADEHAEGNLDGDILQVVAPGADDAEDFAIALPAFLRHLDLLLAVEESGGERVGLEHLGRRSLEDHLAAFPTGKGTHIDDVVGIEHHVFVVLDDDDGVALVAQLLERVDQPDIVALVQADTGFIQYIEYVDELGADLRGEPDALALAAAQCGRPAGEAEVVEPDVEQELESGADFLDNLVGDGALLGLHLLLHRRHPCIEIRQFHVADLGDVLAVDAEMERLAVQSLATTFGTGDHLIDRLRPLLRPGLLLIDAQALHVGRHLLVIDALDINSRHDAETLAMGTGSLGRVEGEIVGRRVAVAKTGGGTHELFGEMLDS